MTIVLALVALGAVSWVIAGHSDRLAMVWIVLGIVLLATAGYRFNAAMDDMVNASPQGRASNARATIAAATAAVAGATAESELRALERAASVAATAAASEGE